MAPRISEDVLYAANEQILVWAFDSFYDALSKHEIHTAETYLRGIENIVADSDIFFRDKKVERIVQAHERLFYVRQALSIDLDQLNSSSHHEL